MKRTAKEPKTWKSRSKKAAKWTAIVSLVLALMGVGAFAVLYNTIEVPNPNADFKTETSFIYYNNGEDEIGRFAIQDRDSIPLGEMPQTLKDAVIAAENRTFWTDSGIDPKGILRAAFSNAQGNSTQGASTITQQYVKILYLTQERSLTRKVKEAILSLKLQRQQTKSQILEGYLNTIYFGRGAYGVQAAAQAYFDKPAKDLSLQQSAVLASVLNNPTSFDPANGKDAKEALKGRYQFVLDGMAELDFIDADEAEQARENLPKFPQLDAESTYGGQRGHALKLVRDELNRLGFTDEEIDGQGLRITTTFTKKAMDAAKDGVLEQRPEGFKDKELHVAVASVEPGTGALRGFYGGQDYLDSQINWASAGGMVGSTMKPVTLAAAIKEGYSLEDTFEGNSPFEFPDGLEVRNEGGGDGNDYGSSVDAIYAMEQSINTAFVDMSDGMEDGPQKIYDMARKMGIPGQEPSKKFPGIPTRSVDMLPDDTLITLGKARISAINMANTYATLAAGGQRSEVHVIDKVVDATGETVYDYKSTAQEVLDPDIAADVSFALQETVADGTGRTAADLEYPAAGKTGTATNTKDQVSSAWFVGYTPQLATAVMYVRGDGDDQLDGWLPSYFGSAFPTSTWLAVMQRAMEGEEVEEFPEPVYVDGEAPEDGHSPVVTPPPAPSPTRKPPKPSETTTSPSPTPTPTPTPTPSPTPTPTPTPTPSCGVLGCQTPSPSDPPPSEPPPSSAPPSPSAAASRGYRSSYDA